MDAGRRRGATREIVGLCHSGLDVDTLVSEAMRHVGLLVPYDRICWHTVDPATLIFTSGTQRNLGGEPRLPTYEYQIPDVNKWADLARRPFPAGVLSEATRGDLETSARYRDLLHPRGVAHELRASLVSDTRCWAFLGLYRDRGRPDFASDDAAFLAEVSQRLADGVRRGLLLDAVSAPAPAGELPGVVVLDPAGEVTAMNSVAEELVSVLPDDREPAEQALPHSVLAVAAQARRGADATGAPARCRARTVTGQWVVLHGTRLGNGPGAATAVLMEPARPSELAELIVLAYGFTPREREVTRLVLLGQSTAQIAQELHLSPFTVQDYLKAVFDKVGVRSRRELVGAIARDHYWTRAMAGDQPGADGFFAAGPAAARRSPAGRATEPAAAQRA